MRDLEDVAEALDERPTRDDIEDVITQLASAVVLLTTMVVNLGGTPTTAITIVEYCTEVVAKVSER